MQVVFVLLRHKQHDSLKGHLGVFTFIQKHLNFFELFFPFLYIFIITV